MGPKASIKVVSRVVLGVYGPPGLLNFRESAG
jgi:hypothetical protein